MQVLISLVLLSETKSSRSEPPFPPNFSEMNVFFIYVIATLHED